jgi:hypothetical protein
MPASTAELLSSLPGTPDATNSCASDGAGPGKRKPTEQTSPFELAVGAGEFRPEQSRLSPARQARPPARAPPPIESALVYSVSDVVQISRLSRAKIFQLIAAGTLKSVLRCGRRLVLAGSLREFLLGGVDPT